MFANALFSKRQVDDDLDNLLPPVIRALVDKDQKVQQGACDSIFNIIKACKENILKSRHFLDIFEKIIELIEQQLAND